MPKNRKYMVHQSHCYHYCDRGCVSKVGVQKIKRSRLRCSCQHKLVLLKIERKTLEIRKAPKHGLDLTLKVCASFFAATRVIPETVPKPWSLRHSGTARRIRLRLPNSFKGFFFAFKEKLYRMKYMQIRNVLLSELESSKSWRRLLATMSSQSWESAAEIKIRSWALKFQIFSSIVHRFSWVTRFVVDMSSYSWVLLLLVASCLLQHTSRAENDMSCCGAGHDTEITLIVTDERPQNVDQHSPCWTSINPARNVCSTLTGALNMVKSKNNVIGRQIRFVLRPVRSCTLLLGQKVSLFRAYHWTFVAETRRDCSAVVLQVCVRQTCRESEPFFSIRRSSAIHFQGIQFQLDEAFLERSSAQRTARTVFEIESSEMTFSECTFRVPSGIHPMQVADSRLILRHSRFIGNDSLPRRRPERAQSVIGVRFTDKLMQTRFFRSASGHDVIIESCVVEGACALAEENDTPSDGVSLRIVFGENASNKSVLVSNTTFRNNHLTRSSSFTAVFNQSRGGNRIFLDRCRFFRNSAIEGGAFQLLYDGTRFSPSTSAQTRVGRPWSWLRGQTERTRPQRRLKADQLEVRQCRFDRNRAVVCAGAVLLRMASRSALNVTLSECVFASNKAGDGVERDTPGGAVLVQSRQERSTGPLRWTWSERTYAGLRQRIVFRDCQFVRNRGLGVVYVLYGTVTFSGERWGS